MNSTATMTPQAIVKAINAHCDKGNGIYVDFAGKGCQRCFRAQVIKDLEGAQQAYVTPDFGTTWLLVTPETKFDDGNWGVPIGNLPMRRAQTKPL